MLATYFDSLTQGDKITNSTDWAWSRKEGWEVIIQFMCESESYFCGGVFVLILCRDW